MQSSRKRTRNGKKSKKGHDDDYSPSEEDVYETPNSGQNEFSLMNQNRSFILDMQKNKSKPKEIAAALCKRAKLADGAIKPKEVSNWLGYQKKAKKAKLLPVAEKNNNLFADFSDNCMFNDF
jgi:hypothetical protein